MDQSDDVSHSDVKMDQSEDRLAADQSDDRIDEPVTEESVPIESGIARPVNIR